MTLVRPLTAADAPACDEIVASLPYFFADPKGIAECSRDVRSEAGWVVEDKGIVTAFLTLSWSFPASAEIKWLAVHPNFRRAGRGRLLVEEAAASARARGANLLHLLTSASRDGPEVSDGYSGTRLFYETMGFFPTRELRLEGWSDETLLLVRPLA